MRSSSVRSPSRSSGSSQLNSESFSTWAGFGEDFWDAAVDMTGSGIGMAFCCLIAFAGHAGFSVLKGIAAAIPPRLRRGSTRAQRAAGWGVPCCNDTAVPTRLALGYRLRASHPPRKRGGMMWHRSSQNFDFSFQASLHRSRGAFLRPSYSADALPEKVRGRAGRRGSDGPTGFDASPHRSGTAISAETGVRIVEPQVRLLSSVPRAVFEAFLRTTPGG